MISFFRSISFVGVFAAFLIPESDKQRMEQDTLAQTLVDRPVIYQIA